MGHRLTESLLLQCLVPPIFSGTFQRIYIMVCIMCNLLHLLTVVYMHSHWH